MSFQSLHSGMGDSLIFHDLNFTDALITYTCIGAYFCRINYIDCLLINHDNDKNWTSPMIWYNIPSVEIYNQTENYKRGDYKIEQQQQLFLDW